MPGLLALIDGSLPSGRYRRERGQRGRRVSTPALADRSRPRSRRRRAAPTAPTWRCWWRPAATARWRTPASASSGASCGAGDLLVVNTSATLPAALPGRLDGEHVLSCASRRRPTRRQLARRAADARSRAATASPRSARGSSFPPARTRRAARALPRQRAPLPRPALARASRSRTTCATTGARSATPQPSEWPIDAYQTVFAPRSRQRGDAERRRGRSRPSSSPRSSARGVLVAPVTLHAGVSSLERGEAPYPERYRVPAATARLVNAVHGWGGRVIARGHHGGARARDRGRAGRRRRRRRGLDEPRRHPRARPARGRRPADRLARAELVAPAPARGRGGPDLLERSYAAAHARGYRWHEFGDSHLILP